MRNANIYIKAKYSLDECPSFDPCTKCIVSMTCVDKCIPKVKYDIKKRKEAKPIFKLKQRKIKR